MKFKKEIENCDIKLNDTGLPILPADLDDHDDEIWNEYLTKEEEQKYLLDKEQKGVDIEKEQNNCSSKRIKISEKEWNKLYDEICNKCPNPCTVEQFNNMMLEMDELDKYEIISDKKHKVKKNKVKKNN